MGMISMTATMSKDVDWAEKQPLFHDLHTICKEATPEGSGRLLRALLSLASTPQQHRTYRAVRSELTNLPSLLPLCARGKLYCTPATHAH